MFQFDQAWLKSLSALCINLSAAFFSIILIGGAITAPTNFIQMGILMTNCACSIMTLILGLKIERKLYYD